MITQMINPAQFLDDMTSDKMTARLIRAKIALNEFALSSDGVEL